VFAALPGAGVAVSMPGTSKVADVMLASAGFVDEGEGPIPALEALQGIQTPPIGG